MKRIIVLAVVAFALAFVAGAGAASPVVSSVSATGTERTSNGTTVDSQQVNVTWTLAQGEYACTLKATSPDAQQIVVLSAGATSANVSLPAAAGSTIAVDLEWSNAAGPAIDASNACNVSRTTSSTSATAQAYTPPAPPPPPAAPAPAPSDPSTPPATTPAAPAAPTAPTTTDTTTTPSTADLQAQIDALAARIAALEARTKAVEDYLAAGGFITDTVSSAYVVTVTSS